MTRPTEVLIVGGGIIGLTLAKALIEKGMENIVILEKEEAIGLHASGRNSGVLHAGIYYPPDSLKAKLCFQGNQLMQQYCLENNLPLKKTGKVIVAKEESEVQTLLQLQKRAETNGAKVSLIDEKELAGIEPNAKTIKKALYSHDTAVVDSLSILKHLTNELIHSNKVKILTKTKFLKKKRNVKEIITSDSTIQYQYFINAAGSYADKIAHQFGVAQDCFFLPFKGIYHALGDQHSHLINGNIYPVPNLNYPFLGIHFTKNIHGKVYVGPSAIPVFGREQYSGFKGIDQDALTIIWNELNLFMTQPQFRKLALTEFKKYHSNYFFQDAKRLVKQLQPNWLLKTSKAGIRPQLISKSTKQLLQDFYLIKADDSLHILNAISPAFTSSLAFANYIIENYYR